MTAHEQEANLRLGLDFYVPAWAVERDIAHLEKTKKMRPFNPKNPAHQKFLADRYNVRVGTIQMRLKLMGLLNK